MSKNMTFNKISDLLNEIAKKNEALRQDDSKAYKIEIDILKGKIRELYEAVNELESIEIISDKSDDDSKVESEEVEKSIEEPEIVENPIIEELTPEEEIEEKQVEKVEEPNQKEEKVQQPITGDLFSNITVGTIADKFQDTKKSLHDKIANLKDGKSIGESMQKQHINDIKTAIGINEKFLFINELFDGDLSNYNDAINKLNKFENLEQTFEYYDELEEKYKWDKTIQSYSQLKTIIERKFK